MIQLDYNLSACLNYNPQDNITDEDIAEVLAVYEGENDERDWRWIVRLTSGNWAYIRGGCDYTGWDCQSWATSTIALPGSPLAQEEDDPEVRAELLRQLEGGKDITWRESKDAEMGIEPGLKQP